jgi:hypothetical protein
VTTTATIPSGKLPDGGEHVVDVQRRSAPVMRRWMVFVDAAVRRAITGVNGVSGDAATAEADAQTGIAAAAAAQATANAAVPKAGGTMTGLLVLSANPAAALGAATKQYVDSAVGGSEALTSGHIFVGNGSNVATDVAMSGDASIANTGAVTVSKTGGVAFGAFATGTDAANLTGTIASARMPGSGAGSGTVTSVGLSAPVGFSVTGSPITSSGTLGFSWTNQLANRIMAGPTSGTAAPSFRLLVGGDLPNPSSTTLGGVQSVAAVSHQWVASISTAGVPSLSQPDFSDLSGSAAVGQVPDLSATYLALAGGTMSGTVTFADGATWDNAAGVHLKRYATASAPSPSAGGLIQVTDEGGGKALAFSATGTTWRRTSDAQAITSTAPSARGLLSLMDTRVTWVNQDIVYRTFQKLADGGVVLGTDLLGLWVFAGAPASSTDALRNWATLGTRDLASVGSPTWSQTGGFTGDGSTALLTGATAATYGAAQNNLSIGVYVLAASATAKAVIGVNNAATTRVLYLQSATSGALVTRFQDGTNDNYTPSKYTGMFTLTRGAAANYQASVDDGAQTTVTRTSTAPGLTLALLGTNDSVGSEFSTAQLAFAFVGVNLTAAKIATIRAALVDYYLVQTGVLSSAYTVANLPGSSAAYQGQRLMVSDSSVAASGNFGATLTGAGTNHVPAYYESGTPAWRIG